MGVLGRKVGMTRFFKEDGRSLPVTVLELGPNPVVQIKKIEKDGYNAVQLGFGEQKMQRLNKAKIGHLKEARCGAVKILREFRLDKSPLAEKLTAKQVGDEVRVEEVIEAGMLVNVTGATGGKGYAGVVKRHGMAGFIRTHGTHEYRRHGGSIGCRKFPGRVFKNKRMAGHLGDERKVQLTCEVVAVDAESNTVLVRGSVPGYAGGLVMVVPSKRV